MSTNATDFLVRFWGVRGSRCTEEHEIGNMTSCIEVLVGGKRLVIDAGMGVVGLGNQILAELARDEQVETHFFFSHLHIDHIHGLQFFKPLYHPKFQCTMWSREGLCRIMRKQIFDNNTFPVPLAMLNSKITYELVTDQAVIVIPSMHGDNIVIEAKRLNHHGGCFGYLIQYRGKTVAITPDHEEVDMENAPPEQQQLERNLIELCTGVDLHISECQYTDAIYMKNWGHERVSHFIKVVAAAQPRRVITTHHDPDKGTAELVRTIAESIQSATTIPTTFAYQGMEVTP